MKSKILRLADHFLRNARASAEALAVEYDVTNVLLAVNALGEMPRKGHCKALGDAFYTVHGAGCRIESQRGEIDFDFGPDSTIPGFDPWKLYNFARDRRETYPWLPDRHVFNQKIEELKSEGQLAKLSSCSNSNLLHLTTCP